MACGRVRRRYFSETCETCTLNDELTGTERKHSKHCVAQHGSYAPRLKGSRVPTAKAFCRLLGLGDKGTLAPVVVLAPLCKGFSK